MKAKFLLGQNMCVTVQSRGCGFPFIESNNEKSQQRKMQNMGVLQQNKTRIPVFLPTIIQSLKL